MDSMNYKQFHNALFPGDPLSKTQNPADTPDEIISEISSCTRIPEDWLQKSMREVLEGLSGLQCLWFLHGASGETKGILKTPKWYPMIINFIHDIILSDPQEKKKGIKATWVHEENWPKGTVAFEKEYKDRKEQVQNYKVGKFIDEFAELSAIDAQKMHHELKWRSKSGVYKWEVSCHPYDVLTMSYNRPWPSCMQPDHMFEFGPLTDMAAGSAILWFYNPGASAPTGRLVLRPYLTKKGDPMIASGGRLYGSGANIDSDALNEMLGPWLEPHGIQIKKVKICPKGEEGLALTRAIYSDVDRAPDGCKQSLERYKTAYENLDALWPEPELNFEMASVAEMFKDEYEYRGEEEGDDDECAEVLMEAAANREIMENYLLGSNPPIMELLELQSYDEAERLAREYLEFILYDNIDCDDNYEISDDVISDTMSLMKDIAVDVVRGSIDYVYVFYMTNNTFNRIKSKLDEFVKIYLIYDRRSFEEELAKNSSLFVERYLHDYEEAMKNGCDFIVILPWGNDEVIEWLDDAAPEDTGYFFDIDVDIDALESAARADIVNIAIGEYIY